MIAPHYALPYVADGHAITYPDPECHSCHGTGSPFNDWNDDAIEVPNCPYCEERSEMFARAIYRIGDALFQIAKEYGGGDDLYELAFLLDGISEA